MRELSVTEQRYQAVLAVISDGETVSGVAARYGVHRKTLHQWLARYEAEGLEGLADRSHRPRSCPHQTPADVEAAIATMRTAHPSWGPRRLVHELDKAGISPPPSESPRPAVRSTCGSPNPSCSSTTATSSYAPRNANQQGR